MFGLDMGMSRGMVDGDQILDRCREDLWLVATMQDRQTFNRPFCGWSESYQRNFTEQCLIKLFFSVKQQAELSAILYQGLKLSHIQNNAAHDWSKINILGFKSDVTLPRREIYKKTSFIRFWP